MVVVLLTTTFTSDDSGGLTFTSDGSGGFTFTSDGSGGPNLYVHL